MTIQGFAGSIGAFMGGPVLIENTTIGGSVGSGAGGAGRR